MRTNNNNNNNIRSRCTAQRSFLYEHQTAAAAADSRKLAIYSNPAGDELLAAAAAVAGSFSFLRHYFIILPVDSIYSVFWVTYIIIDTLYINSKQHLYWFYFWLIIHSFCSTQARKQVILVIYLILLVIWVRKGSWVEIHPATYHTTR